VVPEAPLDDTLRGVAAAGRLTHSSDPSAAARLFAVERGWWKGVGAAADGR
jgi:hypothetical protein